MTSFGSEVVCICVYVMRGGMIIICKVAIILTRLSSRITNIVPFESKTECA